MAKLEHVDHKKLTLVGGKTSWALGLAMNLIKKRKLSTEEPWVDIWENKEWIMIKKSPSQTKDWPDPEQ